MAGSKKLEVQIVGDAKGLTKSFNQASKSASSFGDKMMKAGKLAALGLGAGVAVVGVALKKSVDAALEAEKAQTRLDAAFKATSASAKERAESMKQVNDVSLKSGLDDEDLMDTLGRLARVTGDTSKAQRDMAISADLARGRGIDLSAATMIVTKAELGNVGALKRIGIEIPKVTSAQDALKASHEKATVAQLKAAKAADDTATRQSAIAALQKQYAGDAEAYGKTAAGAQERFQVAVENLQEAVGAKLLPVLTRFLTWVVDNLPTFERVTLQVFDKVGAIIDALKPTFAALTEGIRRFVQFSVTNWPRVQEAAERVVAWYRGTLQPAIQNVVAALTAIWDRFGGAITSIARTAFGVATTVIRNALTIIKAVIEGVLALIRGDWSQAWDSLKTVVKTALSSIGTILTGFASIAATAALAIGTAIVNGIIAGVGQMAESLKAAVIKVAKDALDAAKKFLHISSPSKKAADEIGQPLGEGIIMGFLTGSADLPAKVSEKLRAALEAGRQAVEASRGALASAWSGVSSDALSAFDAIASGVLTKSEKLLAKLQAQRAESDRAGAVTDAQAALAAATAGTDGVVDPAAVAAAQKQLDDALFAQREFGLQQRAAQERRELDARTAMRRRDLENALAALGEKLNKEGSKAASASEAVLKLLGKYGVNFKAVGAEMGAAWISGLKETIAAAAKGAGSLKGTIEKAAAGIDAPGRAAGGPVAAGKAYMVGERGPELFMPGRSGSIVPSGGGGGNATFNINLGGDHVATIVWDQMRQRASVFEKRNGRSAF